MIGQLKPFKYRISQLGRVIFPDDFVILEQRRIKRAVRIAFVDEQESFVHWTKTAVSNPGDLRVYLFETQAPHQWPHVDPWRLSL
jgi:hypothetical protein